MKSFIAIGGACLLLVGCVTYRLAPNELYRSQRIIYVEGYEAIMEDYPVGENNGLIVSVFGYPTDKVLALHVFFGNATDQPINVLPDTINVEGFSDRGLKHIKVWEANEYIKKIKRRQNTALILQAIAGAMDAASSGYSTTTTYGSYYGSSSYGSFSGTYSGYSTTYDSSAVAEANARNSAAIASQAQANANNLAYLEAVLLKRNTLMPGNYIAGAVYCEREICKQYRVSIPFRNELFIFSFKLIEE
jgi:hypothetical protein